MIIIVFIICVFIIIRIVNKRDRRQPRNALLDRVQVVRSLLLLLIRMALGQVLDQGGEVVREEAVEREQSPLFFELLELLVH